MRATAHHHCGLRVTDIDRAAVVLRDLETSNGKIAADGYCLGGRLAFLAAAEGLVDAGVSYYGTGVHRVVAVGDKTRVPFLMHIAEQDHLCDQEAQRHLFDTLADKPNFSLRLHPGVGHAFARPNSPQWNGPAAQSANEMTFEFLAGALEGAR